MFFFDGTGANVTQPFHDWQSEKMNNCACLLHAFLTPFVGTAMTDTNH